MIRSLLDTDFYKLTMGQAVHALYPYANAEYSLIVRDPVIFSQDFMDDFTGAVRSLSELRLRKEELEYLQILGDFSPVYLEFLKNYQFDIDEISFSNVNGNLKITVRGPWYRTIYWEVPLMAIISEVFFQGRICAAPAERSHTNDYKIKLLDFYKADFADFGTRRRHSFKVQDEFVKNAKSSKYFMGTSNVYLSMKHDVEPVGTYAHEWVMYHGAVHGPSYANYSAMESWYKLYGGKYGTALTDTYGTDVFLRDYDEPNYEANMCDGWMNSFPSVRQDSGDPFKFAEKMIEWYEEHDEDPKDHTIIFSDSLTAEKAVALKQQFGDRINCKFGIGTSFTNDVGQRPLNMVIKATRFQWKTGKDWRDAVKLSDVEGKETGSPEDVVEVKQVVKDYLGGY